MPTRQYKRNNGEVITQRLFVLEDGKEIWAPEKCCLFCNKCTDVWYDNQGPYMYACSDNTDKNVDLAEKGYEGTCDRFVEDTEVDAHNEEIREAIRNGKEMLEELKKSGAYNELLQKLQNYILYGEGAIKDAQTQIPDCRSGVDL